MAGMGEALGYIEHYRNADDAMAVGDSFTQADAALIPLFFFLDALDKGLGTAALVAARPGLAGWWARAKASPLGAQAIAEQAEGLRQMMAAR
jgi:glutathione S-transferase